MFAHRTANPPATSEFVQPVTGDKSGPVTLGGRSEVEKKSGITTAEVNDLRIYLHSHTRVTGSGCWIHDSWFLFEDFSFLSVNEIDRKIGLHFDDFETPKHFISFFCS